MKVFLDNSRLSHFKMCAMFYFLRDILHWTKDSIKPPLLFGACIHEALAVIFLQCKSVAKDELKLLAMNAFNTEWEARGGPKVDDFLNLEKFKMRIPFTGSLIIDQFIDTQWKWLQLIEVLSVEKPFLFPLLTQEDNQIDPVTEDILEVYLCGRRDVVYRENGNVWVGEHKTTSLYSIKNGIQPRFFEGFTFDSQPDTYLHATLLEYPLTMGVRINAFLVNEKHQYNKKYPLIKSLDTLASWHKDAQHWSYAIRKAINSGYFPHNSTGCMTPYGPCEFKEICTCCTNPAELNLIFPGYKKEKWEPFDEAELKSLLIEQEAKDGT